MKLPRALLAVFLVFGSARAAAAQIPGAELTQVLVSRPQLESLLTRYEAAAQSRDFSGAVREGFRRQAELVRIRLADGDFRVGDRILLAVEGESTLADTFLVQAGREVLLPGIGPVPLHGVLRIELADYLTTRLRQFLIDPKVRARSLIRVVIKGAVTRQGFYTVPVDIPIDAVFEAAGGPSATADLDKMRISRGREVLYEDDVMQQLITQGVTIDALGIQAGDAFSVEAQPVRNIDPERRVRTIQYLISLPISLFALGRLLGF